jgi:hypothetical protein
VTAHLYMRVGSEEFIEIGLGSPVCLAPMLSLVSALSLLLYVGWLFCTDVSLTICCKYAVSDCRNGGQAPS